jgi:hypothetical protein
LFCEMGDSNKPNTDQVLVLGASSLGVRPIVGEVVVVMIDVSVCASTCFRSHLKLDISSPTCWHTGCYRLRTIIH